MRIIIANYTMPNHQNKFCNWVSPSDRLHLIPTLSSEAQLSIKHQFDRVNICINARRSDEAMHTQDDVNV